MNLHQSRIPKEFHPGNWSLWWLQLLRPHNQHLATNRHGHWLYPSTPPDLPVFGLWKSPDKATSTLSYSSLQPGRWLYSSPNSTSLSPMSKARSFGFTRSSKTATISGHQMYWSNCGEAPADAYAAVANRKSGERQPETGNGYRLLGIPLVGNSNVEETSMVATVSGVVEEDRLVPSLDADSDRQFNRQIPTDLIFPQSAVSEPEKSSLRSPQEKAGTRSCTKVRMQGIVVGRAVDLTRFDQYDDLLRKQEEMFGTGGKFCGPAKKWQVIYTDNEDDMMMVSNNPWREFCSMVRKIYIYTCGEAKRLTPKVSMPVKADVTTGR